MQAKSPGGPAECLIAAPTLYEDWQQRREYLRKTGAPLGQAYLDVQIHILDYLLKRYQGTAQAIQPARFSFAGPLYLNRRAIVVHHHLGTGQAYGTESPEEAGQRVSRILKRIRAQDPQGAILARASGVVAVEELNHTPAAESSPERSPGFRQLRLWRQLAGCIRRSASWPVIREAVENALREGPLLPEIAVAYLAERVGRLGPEALAAGELLLRCNNPSVADYGLLAWQGRISEGGGEDAATVCLEELFAQPAHLPKTIDKVRGALADNSLAVRLHATRLLERLGTLDDIGLVLDLLALPPVEEEDPCERQALLHLLEALSSLARGTGL